MFATEENGFDISKFKIAFYMEDINTHTPKDDFSMLSMFGLIE
jgi:hypothetical protein